MRISHLGGPLVLGEMAPEEAASEADGDDPASGEIRYGGGASRMGVYIHTDMYTRLSETRARYCAETPQPSILSRFGGPCARALFLIVNVTP